jgi:3-oxoacyl-[acyl-carrier protein] reductase
MVTGSSRGIGKQIALTCGRTGERVVINFRNREQDAQSVAAEIIRSGGDAFVVKADVRQVDEVQAMMQDVQGRWGRIDILVNNAGIAKDELLLRMSEQDWDQVIDTNLTGAFNCIRAVSEIMIRQQQGHIINVSSIIGLQGRAGQACYAASKAGLIGLTKASAKELGSYNIQVNAILPGYIPTDMGSIISDRILAQIKAANTLGRVNDPSEVAEFIYRLTLMRNVSGQVFNLDSRIL